MDNFTKARWIHRSTMEGDVYYDRKSRAILHGSHHGKISNNDEIASLPTFNPLAPLRVYLDPTYLCNLECRHCMTNSSPNVDTTGEMTTSKIISIIDEFAKIGVLELSIAGGEPLCHPDIFLILEHARNIGLNVLLTTNGQTITQEIANKLVGLNLSEIRVSFQGAQKVHDEIAGSGSYRQTMEGAILLSDVGANPMARLTLCKGSDEELDELFNDLELAGVKHIKITTIKDSGRASLPENQDILGFQPEDNIDVKLKALGKKYNIIVKLEDILQSEPDKNKLRYSRHMNCGAGYQTAYISPNGDVYICSALPEYSLGNLKDMSFMEVWTSLPTTKYRQMTHNCSHYSLCEVIRKQMSI
ncbi:radical SAM protein [Wukongibacter baidiensis]|uniref:radical SAM protein n=1 Tax=Wukongibacter baidiensis TaxID=1723361 RepID=UPI003D7F9379